MVVSDRFNGACTSEVKVVLFLLKAFHGSLFISNDLAVYLDQSIDIRADRVGEDEFASQAVAVIELCPIAQQLSHDLDKARL